MRRCRAALACLLLCLAAVGQVVAAKPAANVGRRLLQLDSDLTAQLASLTNNIASDANADSVPALLEFRTAFRNWDEVYDTGNFTGWEEGSSVPVCSWTHVQCSGFGQFAGLDLSNLGLTGSIDSNWTLQNVQVLNLSSNALSGTLPSTWGKDFPSMTTLWLYGNNISGPLPDDWDDTGSFQFLQDLRLYSNQLTGTLPTTWGANFAAIRTIDVSDNLFAGAIPPAWGQDEHFPTLAFLNVSRNQLNGTLPTEWGTGQGNTGVSGLSSLRTLDAHQNNLAGALPAVWAPSAQNLSFTYLDLSTNALTGTLPAAWNQFPLVTLRLFLNQLQGALPTEWGTGGGRWTGLQDLELQNNTLTGYLPTDWGNNAALQSLLTLAIYNNNISGPVPDTWAQAGRFKQSDPRTTFVVRPGNDFMCGTVPAISNTQFLEVVDYNQQLTNPGSTLTTDQIPGFGRVCPPPPPPVAPPPATPPPPSPGIIPSASSSSSSISGGAIAGIIIGALAAVALVALAVFCLCCRSRKRKNEHEKAFAGTTLTKVPSSRQSNSTRWLSWRSDTTAPFSFRSNHKQPLTEKSQQLRDSDELAPPHGRSKQTIEMSNADGTTMTHSSPTRSLISTQDWAESPAVGRLQLPHSFEWRINPEQLAICKRPNGSDWRLGSGGFGTVYKAVKDDVHDVAMKIFKNEDGASVAAQTHKFQNEIAIMKGCRDKNIVQFYGACVDQDQLIMVTELMENGDLFSALADPERMPRVLWYRRGRRIALDVARGLHYLHSNNVIHFDLKSANILLARDDTAKLADVGLSHALVTKTHVVNSVMRGTWSWAAPETITGLRCTEKVDIWSFGIVLWELVTGEQPERGRNRPVRVPAEAPKEIDMLIAMCTDPDPTLRPTAKEIIQHILNAPSEKPAK